MQSAGLVGLGEFDSFFMIKNRAMGFSSVGTVPGPGARDQGGLAVYYLFRICGVYWSCAPDEGIGSTFAGFYFLLVDFEMANFIWSCAPDEGIGPTGFMFSSVGTVP